MIKSAKITLRFLDIVAYNRNGLAFTDIQTRLGVPKSSAHSLIRGLDGVRAQSYALTFDEAKDFAACIALPLRQDGGMIAAFSVTYPVCLLQTADHAEIVAVMRRYQRIAEGNLLTK